MHGRVMPSDRSRRRIAVAIARRARGCGRRSRHGAGLPRRLSGGKDRRGAAARPPRPRCLHGAGARKSSLGHEVRLGEAPSDVVVAGRSAWLLLPSAQRLLRIDTRTHQLTRSFRLPWFPLWRLAAGNGFVWAAQDGGTELARISIATGRLERFRPGRSPSSGLAAGDRSLWVASEGELARIVPENGTAGRHFPYDGSGRLTFGEGALWSLEDHGVLRKLDPETGRVLARADLHATVSDVVVGGGLVWASVVPDGVVYGLDSGTSGCGARSRSAPTRSASRSPTAGSGSRTRLRGGSRRSIRARVRGGGSPSRPTRRPPRTATGSSGPARCRRRRRCRRPAGPSCGFRSPGDTSLSIRGYRIRHPTSSSRRRRARGSSPTRTGTAPPGRSSVRRSPPRCHSFPDGRTYTFRIRDGFRFSPPSNETVTAATFKHTLERAFSPRLGRGGRGPSEASAIQGLAAYLAGKARHVSGSGRAATRCRSRSCSRRATSLHGSRSRISARFR